MIRMVLDMFKPLKKQARQSLIKNYGQFLLPVALYELLAATAYSVLGNVLWDLAPLDTTILSGVLWLAIQLVALPVLIAVFFRIGICVTEERKASLSEVKSFLSLSNIFKIVTISLVPTLLNLIGTVFRTYENSFDNAIVFYLISFSILAAETFVGYKFFICNYHFAKNEGSVKETLQASFGTMKGRFLKYYLYGLSFILWDLLSFAVAYIGSTIFKALCIYGFLYDFGFTSFFGFMFFYRPFTQLANLLYAKQLYEVD